MSLPIHIIGGGKQRSKVAVTKRGQLIVAPYEYDETQFIELAEVNTAYNFYKPKMGMQFVITGMRIKADRNVSTTVDATVEIYEAALPDTTTSDKILHEEAMVRGESATLLPTNILVRMGKFVNAKTTDDNIFMTVMGYYIPIVT
jgi:hypothetical protein